MSIGATRAVALMSLVGVGVLAGFARSGGGTTSAGAEGGADHQFKVVTSPYEAALLADGDVTRAELDQAYAAMQACFAEGGLQDTGTEYRPPWTIGFDVSAAVEGSLTGDEVSAIADRCEQDYFDAVRDAYFILHRATPSEEDEFRLKITECLNGRGIDVDDSIVTLRQLIDKYQIAELQDFGYCRTAAEVELSK